MQTPNWIKRHFRGEFYNSELMLNDKPSVWPVFLKVDSHVFQNTVYFFGVGWAQFSTCLKVKLLECLTISY